MEMIESGNSFSPLMIGGGALAGIGVILAAIFFVVILIKAFREGVLWGLGCLFLAFPVLLIFVIKSWGDAGGAFLKHLAGGVVAGIGCALMAMGAPAVEVPPEEDGASQLESAVPSEPN